MNLGSVECVVPSAGTLLESPRWAVREGLLSWVDIPTGTLFTLDPKTDEVQSYETGVAPLGAALPRESGGWELVGPSGTVHWDSRQDPAGTPAATRVAGSAAATGPATASFSDPSLISNDAEYDPWGRLYIGRMSSTEQEGAGSLCAVERDGSIRVVAERLTIPNGLAWAPESDVMFFAESIEARVYQIPTSESGEDWDEREVFVELDEGLPDGLTIGPDDCLWLACYGIGRVERFSLAGERLGGVDLPVSQATACVFVGEDLYITTAAEGFSDDDRAREPLAGSLFRVRDAASAMTQ